MACGPPGTVTLKRTHYIALVAIIVLTMVLLKLPHRASANLKRAIGALFLPLIGLGGSSRELATQGSLAILPRAELIRQLEQARSDNDALRMRDAQREEILRENGRLRAQLNLPRSHPDWKLRLARIIGREPANWWRTLRIDLGSRDGVVTNSPVLTADGLVGRISEVTYTQSQVVLLGDPDCRVSVLIRDTGDNGIIAPASSSPLDSALVDILYLSRASKIQPGQMVITSGLGGVFPKGIVVGQIADWRSVDFGLYREARVALAVKLNLLEEVWVKLP